MFISGIQWESVVDGEGVRNTLFVSGCLHMCSGCHNKETWKFNYGSEFTDELQEEFISKCSMNPLIQGVTISGGDSMFSCEDTIKFLEKYKKKLPYHDVWLYTGFTYEEIMQNEKRKELLNLCDVIIDGRYVESKKNASLAFKGSSNQKCINVQQSLKQNKIIEI